MPSYDQGSALPFSEESEKCLLCCLCLGAGDLAKYGPAIPPEMFYIPAHGIIMRALLQILEKRYTLDFPILRNIVKTEGMLEEVGGVDGLNEVWSYLHFSAGTQGHFDTVKALWQARVTIVESLNLIQVLRDPKNAELVCVNTQEYIEKTLTKISIGLHVEEKSFRTKVHEAYEALIHRIETPAITGVTFGVPSLDTELYGLQPGEKCIVAGVTGGGKSALGGQAVVQNAMDGKATAVFSLEMTEPALIHRMFANVGKVSMRSMKTGRYEASELDGLNRAFQALVGFDIFLERRARDIHSIISRCRYLKSRHDISLVVVDYVQLVDCKHTNSRERHERLVADVSHAISNLAIELDIPIIAMSQLNDEGHLRDSRTIGHDADVVLRIEPTEVKENKFINILKQRNGEQGARLPVRFDGQLMQFSDRLEEEMPEDDSPRGFARNANRNWAA